MRHAYALLALATATPAAAQTLNNADTSPLPGDQFTYNVADYVAPGPAGANQTWTFTGLTSASTVAISYVSPAATGQSASFADATVASDLGGDHVFYQADASGLDLLGIYVSPLSAAIPYSNPERMLSYPLAYSNTWSDAFEATFSNLGLPAVRSGTINGNADGYGTLVMPYGTVTGVLRVKTTEDYADDVSGLATIECDFTTYSWYKPGIRSPLLVINDNVTTTFGTPQTEQRATWLPNPSVGMEEALRNAIGIDLFPNPATSELAVVFSAPGGRMTIEVLDNTGRVALAETVSAAMGIGRHLLQVGALPAGLYLVRVTAPSGEQGTQRLVKD